HRAVAGVADAAAAGRDPRAGGLVVADDGPRHHHGGPRERGADRDGVDVDARALVHVGVAGDRRVVDDDGAGAGRIEAAAGVPGVVVDELAVVDRQRPGADVDEVLHHDAAAVGVGDVVGEDHVVQGQAGVALVADAAAGGRGTVGVGRIEGVAVLNGESLHGHQHRGGGGVGGGGGEVEDAAQV